MKTTFFVRASTTVQQNKVWDGTDFVVKANGILSNFFN